MTDSAQATSSSSAVASDSRAKVGNRIRSAFSMGGQAPNVAALQTPPASNPPTDQPAATPASPSDTDQNLALLDKALSEVEATSGTEASPAVEPAPSTGPNEAGAMAQAMPSAVSEAAHQAQLQFQPPAGVTLKESVATGSQTSEAHADVPTGVQVVEHEPNPEIPPEIESFIEKAESHDQQLPQEITIAGDQIELTPTKLPKKPVIVLPITPEVEKEGARKGPHWSVAWLVTWSRKLMKMFSGEIIYRET